MKTDLPSPKTTMSGSASYFVWSSTYLTKQLSIQNMILIPMYWFKALLFGRDISRFWSLWSTVWTTNYNSQSDLNANAHNYSTHYLDNASYYFDQSWAETFLGEKYKNHTATFIHLIQQDPGFAKRYQSSYQDRQLATSWLLVAKQWPTMATSRRVVANW